MARFLNINCLHGGRVFGRIFVFLKFLGLNPDFRFVDQENHAHHIFCASDRRVSLLELTRGPILVVCGILGLRNSQVHVQISVCRPGGLAQDTHLMRLYACEKNPEFTCGVVSNNLWHTWWSGFVSFWISA